VRFNCNKCHDHPFERWTQDQYYQTAAFFAQVGRKEARPSFAGQKIGGSAVEGAKPLVEVVYDSGSGDVKHDRTGQVVAPSFPIRMPMSRPRGLPPRAARQWITSKDNQYFAKSYVNRLWGYLLGVGIIEPIDDIRAGNPPTNPELLDALTKDFVDSGFDMQHMLRHDLQVADVPASVKNNRGTRTTRSTTATPSPAGCRRKRCSTQSSPRAQRRSLPGVPAGFRAAQLPDAGATVRFLDDFGRPVRESRANASVPAAWSWARS
jgi:hypothetical protein